MVLKRFKEGQARLRREIREKTTGYILAAFSFVAGLAWNEAIKSFIDQFFPNKDSILIKFLYAVIVTVIIVVVTIYLVSLTEKKEETKN